MAYQGLVATIPCGQGGLARNVNPLALPVTDLVQASGIVADSGDVWEKEPGAVKLDTTGLGSLSVEALHDWHPDASTQKLVTYAVNRTNGAATLYKSNADATDLDAVTLASGLTSQVSRGRFVAAGKEAAAQSRKLFFLNGYDPVKVLVGDGATMSTITGPPADWSGTNQPTNGLPIEGRLCLFGNANDRHRLYLSTTTDHQNFTGAGALTFAVYPGDGVGLVAGALYRGFAYFWKTPRGIYRLDTREVASANWRVERITEALGAAPSPYAVIPIDDDILFVSADGGLHLLSAVDEDSGVRTSDLAAALDLREALREQVNPEFLSSMTSLWYGAKQQAWLGFIARGTTTNSLIVRLDFSKVLRGGKVRVFTSRRDVPDSFALRRGADTVDRPVMGDNAGVVWAMDQATRTKGGLSYAAIFRTPETDFAWVDPRQADQFATRRKKLDWVQVLAEPAPVTLMLDVYLDGVLSETVLVDLTRGRVRVPVRGSAYRVALAVRDQLGVAHWKITHFQVGFRVTDDRRL